MDVIKEIMCSLAIIGSLSALNNLPMSMQQAARDFRHRIFVGGCLDQSDLEYIHSMLANYPGLANTRLDDGTTLLIRAIMIYNDEIAKLFLQDPHTDVTIPDLVGDTPLHYLVSAPPTLPGIKQSSVRGLYIKKIETIMPLALARGASPFVRNKYGDSALSIAGWFYPEIYEYLANYANYAKTLYNSARKGDLRGVQYALVKGNASVNMKNNALPTRVAIPANEIGNTPFHAAVLGALAKYEQLLPEINRINESRDEGPNKFLPASYFDKQIRKLLAPIDNMLRLIKIHNPDTAVRNDNGETVGDLMIKAITEHPQTGPRLINILLESREQSMVALRRAKIII